MEHLTSMGLDKFCFFFCQIAKRSKSSKRWSTSSPTKTQNEIWRHLWNTRKVLQIIAQLVNENGANDVNVIFYFSPPRLAIFGSLPMPRHHGNRKRWLTNLFFCFWNKRLHSVLYCLCAAAGTLSPSRRRDKEFSFLSFVSLNELDKKIEIKTKTQH